MIKAITTKSLWDGGFSTHLHTEGGAGTLRLQQLLRVFSRGVQLSKLKMEMRNQASIMGWFKDIIIHWHNIESKTEKGLGAGGSLLWFFVSGQSA